jgi:hypothetical protein
MVVGECLTKRFDSSGKKLEFEYEMDDDIKLLKVLCGTQEELKKSGPDSLFPITIINIYDIL